MFVRSPSLSLFLKKERLTPDRPFNIYCICVTCLFVNWYDILRVFRGPCGRCTPVTNPLGVFRSLFFGRFGTHHHPIFVVPVPPFSLSTSVRGEGEVKKTTALEPYLHQTWSVQRLKVVPRCVHHADCFAAADSCARNAPALRNPRLCAPLFWYRLLFQQLATIIRVWR